MTRSLTVVIIVFAAALAAAIVYALIAPASGLNDTTPVAQVNGVAVTRGQLATALWGAHAGAGLAALVDQRIVEQVAREKGLQPDPSRIDYLLGQEETRAGGPRQLDERLAREGRTRDDLRRELAGQALADQVLDSQVEVTEADIKAYYQAHHAEFRRGEMIKARLMLLDTRSNAQAILDVLDEPGADFAGLARELSLDPATRSEGGDMGWIERGDYARELTAAAFAVKPGQHTGIVEYPDGFAIVFVEARKPGGFRSLEEVHNTIEGLLRNEKLSAMRYSWPTEQRKRAKVTVSDEKLRRAYEAQEQSPGQVPGGW